MKSKNATLHAELEERLRFETLIADLSSKFVNLPAGVVDDEVLDSGRLICEALDLDSSALWQWSGNGPGFFTLTHFYNAQAGPQPPVQVSEDDYPWLRDQMLAGRVVPISSLNEMPEEAALDRENARRSGIKSSLCIPFAVGGERPIGILILNTSRAERDWPATVVKRLQLVAQVFANALIRKHADLVLRESEERLSLAMESAEAGLWVLDYHTGLFWATEEARALFGLSPDEVISMERFSALVHPDDWKLVHGALERAVKEGVPVNLEYRIQLGDGRTRWIASRGRPHLAPTGEPERLMGVSIDVNERKQAERALHASEARLAAGTELAGLGYYEVDYGGGSSFVDERFREICGVPENLQGMEPVKFWLEHVHPDDRQRLLDERQKLHEGRANPISTEYRYEHPSQGSRWIHHLARIDSRATSGNGVRTFGVIRDITEQKQVELKATDLQNDLAHVDRVTLLGQLASALAHELSQPLGAILRNAEAAEIMLQEPQPDLEELRAIVTDILRDDHRAGQVIDRLRSLLKRRRLDVQPIELPDVIAEVLLLVRADAASRQVKLTHSVAPDLPLVGGDRIHLQQVLLNLLVNAMDATDGSDPNRRSIDVSAQQTDSATVELRVCDSGPGVPLDSLARLFEPFYTTKSKGMGMGLPVSKTIIEAHKGNLWAENRSPGGACFCFTLRIAKGGGSNQ